MKIAIIGGTGVEHLPLQDRQEIHVETPFGKVGAFTGRIRGCEVVFLKRHGRSHSIPPHKVNYQGNIWALRELGARKIVATAAVGSLSSAFKPGDLVLPDQFLDFTKTRESTFYTGEQGVLHVDMTEPYCPELRTQIVQAGETMNLELQSQAVYVCTEGPRFETPAEIRMFQKLGGDLVGMTGVPEVVLARELGLCYASIGLITNVAAGIAGHQLTHAEVLEAMQRMSERVANLLERIMESADQERHCYCAQAAAELGMF